MRKVNTLYRVSTLGQVDKQKDDIPMQRLACRTFAEEQGWEIVREFEEKGVSGFKVSAKDRDAIQDLKEAAKKNEFDILLVFMFDRIGRIDDETPFVVEWFVKHGIQVWSVKEGEQRFDNHVDKLTNHIRFWQASGESEKTSMRIKTRMQQLTLEGCYTGGPVPYGYQLVDKGRMNKKGSKIPDIDIEPFEAEIVKEIFLKTVHEGIGSYRMAQQLNDRGLQTHQGCKFQSMAINRILRNPRYCGYLVNGEATSEAYQALRIIDDDLFQRAQFILNQRSTADSNKRRISMNTKGKAMLSGNIFCAHCGSRIVTTRYQDRYLRTDGTEYSVEQTKYACYHRSRKLCDCDGQATYQSDRIDEMVCKVMRKLFSVMKGAPNKDKLQSTLKHKLNATQAIKRKTTMELDKYKKQLATLQQEIAKSLMGESLYEPEDLQLTLKATKENIHSLESRLASLESDNLRQKNAVANILIEYNQFKRWSEEFETASLEQKKMIACQLFNRIELGKGYKVTFELNMSYQQFCNDWNDTLPLAHIAL